MSPGQGDPPPGTPVPDRGRDPDPARATPARGPQDATRAPGPSHEDPRGRAGGTEGVPSGAAGEGSRDATRAPGPAGGELPPSAGGAEGVRLGVVEATEGLGEGELLRLALQQAVAALGGYGGFAHLTGDKGGLLRLAATNGLPPALARRWDDLSVRTATAPALAITNSAVAWSSRWPAEEPAPPAAEPAAPVRPTSTPDAPRPTPGAATPADPATPGPASGAPAPAPAPEGAAARPRPVGSGDAPAAGALLGDAPAHIPGGMISAPVVVGGVPVGALSVLTAEQPPGDQQAFLVDLAAVVGARLPRTAERRGGATPWWQEPVTVREQVMQQIAVGTWSWDVDSDRLEIDEVSETILPAAGLDPATWDHSFDSWMERIHPDDRPGVQEALATSLATGHTYAVEYRVIAADGSVNWLELRGGFEYDDAGRPVRLSGTAWNVTDRRSRLAWLGGLIERHPDPIHVLSDDNRVQWANEAARGLYEGGGASMIGQVPWEHQPRLADRGIPEMLARARATPGVAASAELEYEDADGGLSAWHIRAVEVGGYVATQMADVSERRKAELAEAERTQHMTELNAALIRAVGTMDVVDAINAHVPFMVRAEGMIVVCLTPYPHLISAVGYSADYRAELESPGLPQRIAEASDAAGPQFFATAAELEEAWPNLAPVARHGGDRAWAVLPLIVGTGRLGTCVVSWPAPHPFSEPERSLLGTVAVIMAQAIAKAQLYEEARNRAERLQAELLPGRLPTTVQVRSAARYRLAAGEEVGGDWYDTIPLPGGRTLAVIGDVHGHGLEQGIAMGILRHAALTVAALDLPVDEIMAHLNDTAGRIGPLTATCMLVLYDATTGECQVTSAGHPAPVILHPSGKAHEADLAVGQPLGQASVPAPVTDIFPEQDAVLVLYSDGLVAGADRDVSQLADLMSRYAASAPLPRDDERRDAWLETLCDAISRQQQPDPGNPDDAALLALTLGRVPAERIAAWELPWTPESAGRGRTLAAEQIAAWGEDDLTDTATLIVSELIGNAVRHAVGIGTDVADDTPGALRLRLLHHADGTLTCEVYDGSQATPRVRHPLLDDEFGRGLQLVAVTAKRWGTRYTEGGKCIWANVGD